ncbi:fatty acid hydroxylase domain-containing protein 2-like [Haliotis asinina]|uniref:fatty acid hydroxylase domain-containing protein 2-like n=1 Tax=Haliotis asinina TaxID=109174 RepID=UPI003531B799
MNATLKPTTESDHGIWLVSIGTYLVSVTVFWVVGTLFLVVDVTGRPVWIRQFKVQPGKNEPVKSGPLWHTTKVVIINQIFVGLPLSFVNAGLQRYRGCDLTLTLPQPIDFIRDFAVFVVLEEFGFYYSHRLLHHPAFYSWIHKQHHEWTAPISYVAIYAHPIEYIFSNVIPLVLGPLVCGSCLLTTWTWFAIATFTTMIHHSGYHLPFLTSPEFHDFHHLKYNVNYGVTGLLDWFHGTDLKFRAAPQFERHRMIFSADDMKLREDKIK